MDYYNFLRSIYFVFTIMTCIVMICILGPKRLSLHNNTSLRFVMKFNGAANFQK